MPANVRRIYSPPAPLVGRGGALKMVRGDAAFLIMSLYLPPSPSNLRENQLSEKIWKWARRVLDETPSRVVPVLLLDANGYISQTPWPEQIGKYSSKKTAFKGQCVSQHQLTYGIHEKRQEHQWDKNKLTQRVPFSRRTGPPFCQWRKHAGTMKIGTFWAKLNQVLVTAGSDLYAREIQAKISTPQDTLDARHDMTKAKLEVMRLPPRRPKNQIRDSDLPSDIERVRHIFTGWRTYSVAEVHLECHPCSNQFHSQS